MNVFGFFASGVMAVCSEVAAESIPETIRGLIKFVKDKIYSKKEKQIINSFNKNNKKEVYKKIFNELKDQLDNQGASTGIKDDDKIDCDDIRKILNKLFSGMLLDKEKYDTFLRENSGTYEGLDKGKQEEVLKEILYAVNELYEYKFKSLSSDSKKMCEIIIGSLEPYITEHEKLMNRLMSMMYQQSDGSKSLHDITISKYAPECLLRSCPGCGYDGGRLVIDKKNGIVKCAACGKTYNLLQYAEPKLYGDIVKKVDSNLDELLKNSKKIIEIEQKNSSDIEEIKNKLSENCLKGYIKEYLDKCLNGEEKNFCSELRKLIDNNQAFEDDLINKINTIKTDLLSIQKGQKDIITFLNVKNQENNLMIQNLSKDIASLDKLVSASYKYAMEKLSDFNEKSDDILKKVQKLCTDEYLDQKLRENAKVISIEMKNGFEHIQALNSASVFQILSKIDNLEKTSQLNKINENSEKSLGIIEKFDREKEMEEYFIKKYITNIDEFPCPYCGALIDKKQTNDAKCQCNFCENKFLQVYPFQQDEKGNYFDDILKNSFNFNEKDKEFATREKIRKWREQRTVYANKEGCINAPEQCDDLGGLYILSKENFNKKCYLELSFKSKIQILVLSPGITELKDDFFDECVRLEKIVFQPEINFKNNSIKLSYSFKSNKIFAQLMSGTITISGYNEMNEKIVLKWI